MVKYKSKKFKITFYPERAIRKYVREKNKVTHNDLRSVTNSDQKENLVGVRGNIIFITKQDVLILHFYILFGYKNRENLKVIFSKINYERH